MYLKKQNDTPTPYSAYLRQDRRYTFVVNSRQCILHFSELIVKTCRGIHFNISQTIKPTFSFDGELVRVINALWYIE